MISSFALMLNGAADARPWRGGGAVRGGGVAVHPVARGGYGYHGGYGYERRPIYMARPYIRERYYNYYRPPGLIVENYPMRSGYVWVRGSWQWNGYEWTWYPGHYQPVY